jgi:NAD(P)-dependent dehydrogenase (short-subunit alcohol dehydrogenase family)
MAKRSGAHQVVVVTGASGGIGRAVAQAFGARGAKVALLARGELGLAGAAKDVESAGGTALPIAVDVADYGQIEQAARRVEQELGVIDVWVNVAFTSVFAPFMQIEPEEYKRVTEVSYLGYVYATRVALDRMLPRDRGVIVQVGSALAYRGIPLQSAYCGAKHAIQGFHDSLRCELLHNKSNVHVTMVQMPAVNTPQFSWVLSRLPRHAQPVPPIYQPEVAARAVVYAADHPRRREYWVGGSTVGTLIGNKFAAGLLDRYLGKTGYSSQQTDQPRDPEAPANLWEPADGPGGHDFGAHGIFDSKSSTRSYQLWASQHLGLLSGAGAGAAALAGVLVAGSRRSPVAAVNSTAVSSTNGHDAVAGAEHLLDRIMANISHGRFERSLSGLTALSALVTGAEVYLEHYKASFGNKWMWSPIALTPPLVAAGIGGVFSKRCAKTALPVTAAAYAANGLLGEYFHARGVARRPGGWKLASYNLPMGPPISAPGLMAMVGGMGLLAALLRRER